MTVLVVSDALMAGNVRMLRSDSAVGSFLLGLHEKRKKVPHPGLQHVMYVPKAVSVTDRNVKVNPQNSRVDLLKPYFIYTGDRVRDPSR